MIEKLNKNYSIVLKDGRFDTDSGTDANDLKEIFAAIDHDGKPVVLHFHGGLVDKNAGVVGANALTPIYEDAGSYPIFFVWESGWQEVIQQNLPAIFEEPIFQKIITRVAQFAKGKVDKASQTGIPRAAGGVPLAKETPIRKELNSPEDGREPFSDIDPCLVPENDELTAEEQVQFGQKFQDDAVFETLVQEIVNSVTPDGEQPAARAATVHTSTKTLMSPETINELTQPGARGLSTAIMIAKCVGILAKIIQRFAQRRDHGFYLTIVEEIFRAFYVGNAGRFLWDGMKKDIVDSFGVAPDCGGTLFLTELDKLWKSGKRPRITIIGHSAGAIYTCRFLQEVQSRGFAADLHFNVILIAPACDFNLLAKTIQSAGNRIDGLRIFGMGDDRERKDAIVPVVYPSSLLYFVSGVIEQENDCPLVGMARYYSPPYDDGTKFPDIDYVRKFALFQRDHALVWARSTVGDGFNCDMTSHGGWASTQATVASVVHILEKGYDYTTGTHV
ncbi:MAG TPA: alpha/beta hydrolase [Chthoniobacterales bacterium]|nr:alpha/beta hydrolase [Chthoniobacterales bacterium]